MVRDLKITYINKYGKDKNGKEYIDKKGRRFIRAVINAEGLEREASAFIYSNKDPIYHWKEGDQVKAIVEYNGDYINIKAAGKLDILMDKINNLERKIELCENKIKTFITREDIKEEINNNESDNGIKEEELPF